VVQNNAVIRGSKRGGRARPCRESGGHGGLSKELRDALKDLVMKQIAELSLRQYNSSGDKYQIETGQCSVDGSIRI
jgi:hypothetical protein